ncbi:MAG: hypothetical protein JOZ72_15695 [Alphaproteobacteria bacterium]|nr:hypothetical protein [Alphaproteobacteria bacterium]
MTPDDWRLQHLRTQPYLRGVRFTKKPYKAYRPDWDHDHCAACWTKFAEHDVDHEPTLREGFATTEDYARGEDYDWVCSVCFGLFRDEMEWVEDGDAAEAQSK